MSENDIREKMVVHGKSLFERRYTGGGSGNLSARVADGVLVTPTNSCLGRLEAERISKNENYSVLNHDAVEALRKKFAEK
jgi:ribulose-5-phosphate 4-epimerase/fuculose-1-phosphate aldolase